MKGMRVKMNLEGRILGNRYEIIGKVGNDGFGHLLTKAVQEQGIDTTGLVYDNDVHTTLALVLKKENGDRDFAFYRNPGADMNLKEEEVNESLIASSSIFHFGTLSLTDESVKKAAQKGVKVAKENGLTISGTSPDKKLVETIEIKNHPFFIAVQFHPEFKSSPLNPHPLFKAFIEACKKG